MTLYEVSNLILVEAISVSAARGGRLQVVGPEDRQLRQVAALERLSHRSADACAAGERRQVRGADRACETHACVRTE